MAIAVAFSGDLRSAIRSSGALDAFLGSVGTKAAGLLRLPAAWTPADFAVASVPSLDAARIANDLFEAAETILFGLARSSVGASLIVRSNGIAESMRSRGAYRTVTCAPDATALADAMKHVLIGFSAGHEQEGQAGRSASILIHEHIPSDFFGHLSNERRVGTIRSFIGEVWTGSAEAPLIDTFTLQSKKDVTQPSPSSYILVDRETIQTTLRAVARWIHKNIGRAHLEWIASAGRLFIVQCDVEDTKDVAGPMADWTGEHGTFDGAKLKVMSLADRSNSADLRKTRSRLLFQDCLLPVAPVYLLRDAAYLTQIASGTMPQDLAADLLELSALPFMVRIDVVADGNESWENLPASSVLRTVDEARAFLESGVRSAWKRARTHGDVAVAIHHFITARASAWAEAAPTLERVRIDATWGHPDGLQGFPCDSTYLSFPDNERHVFVRFKDEYLDVDASGKSYRRLNGPPWDKQPTLEDRDSEEIAQKTLAVALHLKKPVRVMWFIGTDTRAGIPRCFPWIMVPEFAATADPFLRGDRDVPRELRPDTITQARRLALGAVRRIETESDIVDLSSVPNTFDLGGRRVVLRPAASLIRSMSFLTHVAEAVVAGHWRLVLEGSTLAHAFYLLRSMGVDVESAAEYLAEPRRKKIYEKLVRDLVPKGIQAQGEIVDFRKLPKDQLRGALLRKLVEEAGEAQEADSNSDLLEELADVYEVVRALAQDCGVGVSEVSERADRKRKRKGGFEVGYELIATGGSFSAVTEPGGRQLDLFRKNPEK